MHIHLIAVGGAAMHNIAIALHRKGFKVTGSDDEINEPSLSRLRAAGLLPKQMGWNENNITPGTGAVIVGMHARADNPELLRAQQLGLKIYSYPEYIYEHSQNKTRVVIGGSHGKTTITSMILHVLRLCGKSFDFMAGAQVEGFDTMVQLSDNAPVIIIEGDEYLSSPVDRRPKFHLYKADIGLVSGIAWDHINVFPTFESYVEQFRIFADNIPPHGKLIYCATDDEVKKTCEATSVMAEKIPYTVPSYKIINGITWLTPANSAPVRLSVFGEHNLMNLEAARLVCNSTGVTGEEFYSSIQSFTGAAKRLELVFSNGSFIMYKDFAHSPSKLSATVRAVRQQYPAKKLIACMELHTFSSLDENFLNEYKGCMDVADGAYVYFNPQTIIHKKLKPVTPGQVKESFGRADMKVFTHSDKLVNDLKENNYRDTVLLMMSSGNFDGMDFKLLAADIAHNYILK